MLLKLSVRSAGREFQIVGAAWPYVSHMFYKKKQPTLMSFLPKYNNKI